MQGVLTKWSKALKLARAIVLGLGLCSGCAMAQQALLASRPMPLGDSDTAAPSPYTPIGVVRLSEVPVDTKVALGLALPSETIYKAATPQVPATVCSAALFPVMPGESGSYAFSRAQFSMSSLKASFQHDNLVKMAHNFVPGQPLPDAPSYRPLTPRQKFNLFVHSTYSPDMGFSILGDALIAQASGAWPKFGGGMEGFGNRLGASAAGEEAASFFSGFLFPTMFHQDPRYFRSHQTRIIDRLAYAASRVIVGRSDDGRTVFNYSAISGQFVQAALSNAYIPYRNETVSGTIENALAGLSGVAQAQILNEFWPDIKQFVASHTPGMHSKKPAETQFSFR